MEILSALGLNSTFFIQFVIFLVAFMTLKSLAFNPYLKALEEREDRTKGQEQAAEDLYTETARLNEEFADLSRQQLEEIQVIYSDAKKSAGTEYNNILQKSKTEVEKKMAASKADIKSQIASAEESIKSEVVNVSKLITHQIVGREL
ncbi:MAG: ATP synthase F0 subunit B [Bdellovibrionales bacterium]